MAYDEKLDVRVTAAIADWGTTRKRMFGGTCHLINGNMLRDVYKNFLILRLAEEAANEALKRPGVKPFDVTGKPMKGWVMIEANTLDQASLLKWLKRCRLFVAPLPPK
ncbi:MAG: TfoX/Sxy family protein [Betaproteobacteria bacterium]|nr:MAG: TfoX/Sxy family protein [Betaproteobacteria bacterium]